MHLSDESGKGDCKVFLRKLVGEGEEGRREEMERELSAWDEEELMEALIEIQGEVDQPDVLLRAIQLYGRIVSGMVTGNSGASTPRGKQVMDMDAVRAEMMNMEDELEKRKECLDDRLESSEMVAEVDLSKGWSMWEGSWVPKPIGVV